MKKIFIVYGVLIVLVIILAIFKAGDLLRFLPTSTKGTATVNNQTYKLLLADDEKERMQGLSKRNNLAKDTGMLFVFEKKDRYAFWMKDMRFPIDLIYIDDGKVVDVIENAKPPIDNNNVLGIQVIKPKNAANYVLEINAGEIKKHNVKVGDKVTFQGIK